MLAWGKTWLARLGQGRVLAWVFLLCALPTGLGCALLTPMGAVSDEPEHIARVDGLRTGQVFGIQPVPGKSAGVMLNVAVLLAANAELYDTWQEHRLSPEVRAQGEAIRWTDQEIFCPTQMVDYFPAFYAPGALGLALGKALGVSPLHSLFLGRVAMLMAFLALAAGALRLVRFGGALMFAVLSLPTTLHLAGSFNQDGLLIAACALAVALLTRARPGPNLAWGAALALLALVASAKTPYIVLSLACMAPLRAPGFWRRVGLVGLACVLPLAWFYHVLHGGFSPWDHPAYHPGPLWPGPRDIWLTTLPANNILVLKTHPWAILTLPFTSVPVQWPKIWPLMLGQTGWDAARFPRAMFPGLYVSCAVALAGALAARAPGRSRGDAALVLALVLANFMGVELSLYVTWTHAGAAAIEGVNSRYFLPFVPFLVLVLAGRLALPRGLAAGWFVLPAIVMALVNAVVMPGFIYHIYQMPGP